MTDAGGIELPAKIAGNAGLHELLLHGWDLARATGQEFVPDESSVETCLTFVSALSEGDRSRPFAARVDVPSDATILDQLLGRDERYARGCRIDTRCGTSLVVMSQELEIITFATVEQLWSWLAEHHARHPGAWVRLARSTSTTASISFHQLLEAGIAYGWSESTRRRYDSESFLQKFTPRRTRGTTSERNRDIADRLELEGRMTPAGRHAIGR